MQVPIGYVITIIVTLAGAVGVLFKLYVKAKDDVVSGKVELLKEKEEKVAILIELKRRAEEKKRKDSERREREGRKPNDHL